MREALRVLRLKVRALIRRRQLDRDLEDELTYHLEMRRAANQAHAPFGNVTQIREACRDVWTFIHLENVWRDSRHAMRGLIRARTHSVAVISLLAMAIGANVAIFSLVNALLLRDLPVERPEELIALKRMSRGTSQGMSIPLFEEFRHRLVSVSGLIGIADVNPPMIVDPASGAGPTDVSGAMVSGNYFRVLGVNAEVGRVFTEDDDRFEDPRPVLVLSHAFWQTQFGGDRTVVGRSVLLSGNRFTIIGVAPRELRAMGGDRGLGGDYWVPLNTQPVISGGADRRKNPGSSMLRVMGRLRSGEPLERVHAEAEVLYRQLPLQLARPESEIQVFPGNRGFGDALARQFWPPLRLLMIAVALLLVMACANVASLLLARAGGRQREIAVRQALGSGRARLIRQLLVESLLLAAAGGLLGLGLATSGARALVALAIPQGTPVVDLSIDRNILLFSVAVSVLTTVLFGLVPALHASRARIESALRSSSRGATGHSRRWLNRSLVAAQVALAVILVAGSVQFARSLHRLYSTDPGFDRRQMVLAAVDARSAGYQTDEQFPELARQIIGRLSSMPGVESVAVAATGFLGGGRRSTRTYKIDGRQYGAAGEPALFFNQVSNNYLRVFRVPFASGRDFTPDDRAGSPRVAVVNEAFARYYFSGQSAIGRRFEIDDATRDEFEIVGVVRDAKLNDLRETTEPLAFLPLDQSPARFSHVFVKQHSPDVDVLSALRPAILAVNPRLRVNRVQTLDAALDETLSKDIMAARLSGLFGAVAIALVSFGVYGVISYLAMTRTREIGVRLALGARPGTILRHVVGDALWMVAPGLVIGTAIAVGLERLIASQLFGATPRDPVTFGVVVVFLLSTTALAAFLPARRAAGTAPMDALRSE